MHTVPLPCIGRVHVLTCICWLVLLPNFHLWHEFCGCFHFWYVFGHALICFVLWIFVLEFSASTGVSIGHSSIVWAIKFSLIWLYIAWLLVGAWLSYCSRQGYWGGEIVFLNVLKRYYSNSSNSRNKINNLNPFLGPLYPWLCDNFLFIYLSSFKM